MSSAIAWGEGEVTSAEALAFNCYTCHSAGNGAIVPLADLPGAEIASALRQFKQGARVATIMGRIANGYSDAEIEQIGAYFGALSR